MIACNELLLGSTNAGLDESLLCEGIPAHCNRSSLGPVLEPVSVCITLQLLKNRVVLNLFEIQEAKAEGVRKLHLSCLEFAICILITRSHLGMEIKPKSY